VLYDGPCGDPRGDPPLLGAGFHETFASVLPYFAACAHSFATTPDILKAGGPGAVARRRTAPPARQGNGGAS
jgi:hypothetical protein